MFIQSTAVGEENRTRIILKQKMWSINIEQMARQARKELADLRAMEEENRRMEMHGSGKMFHGAGIVGAGATPSMGLSQFRGGAKKNKKQVQYESESETEMEEEDDGMEGGAGLLTNIARIARPSTAIVPRVAPSGALVRLGTAGRPMATPSLPASYYANLMRGVPKGTTRTPITSTIKSGVSKVATNLRKGLTAQNIATALSLGIPLSMLGSYLADQSGATGDAGYYEDYAGADFQPTDQPTGTQDQPTDLPTGTTTGGPSGVPSDLSPDELAWYLQSGNLPARYSIRTSKRKKGKGKLTIQHEGGASLVDNLRQLMHEKATAPSSSAKPVSLGERFGNNQAPQPYRDLEYGLREKAKEQMKPAQSKLREAVAKKDGRTARAEVVKKIMKERGVSLAEASKIVKAEGLY